jgi:hypothetical protein
MYRLALRQFRTPALVAYGFLVAIGLVLLATGPHLVSLADNFARCQAAGKCVNLANPVNGADHFLQVALPPLVLVAPVLLGIFMGAPLIARELETGTFRLAWTQSVTRTRWLTIKVLTAAALTMVACELLALMIDWWDRPINTAGPQLLVTPGQMIFHGILPLGYAAFAFALGTSFGVILRRTVPAMVATVVLFATSAALMSNFVGRHLFLQTSSTSLKGLGVGIGLSPAGLSVVPPPLNNLNGYVSNVAVVNAAGQAPSSATLERLCPNIPTQISQAPGAAVGPLTHSHPNAFAPSPAVQEAFQQCRTAIDSRFHAVATFIPESKFWALQGVEVGLFVGAAGLLFGLTTWWVRRRLV